MGAEPGRAGWVVPGAALTTLVFVQVLRVWFPTVLFVVGDAGSTSAIVMGAFALGCLTLGPLLGVVSSHRRWPGWLLGTVVLAAGYVGFLFTEGGSLQAVTSTVAVIGGAMALTALAAVPGPGTWARTGIVLGLAAEITIHAVLGTYSLAWQRGVVATTVSIGLAVALVTVVRKAHREFARREPVVAAGQAWPWLVLAPVFLLALVIAGAPGRVAVATGWPPSLVTATIVAGQALAVLGVLLAPRLSVTAAAAVGGGLTLIGSAGALQAAGVTSALAQIALAAGLAVIAVSEPPTTVSISATRRAAAAGGGLLGFGVLTFVYYAAYDIRLGFYNRAVLLAAAVVAAVLAGLSTRSSASVRLRPTIDRRRLARVAVVLLAIVGLSAVVRLDDGTATTAPGEPGAEIRLMLYNVHMGYDPEGRFSVSRIAEVIRAQDPDIVVLNEVDRGWLTTGGHDLLQLLADELDLHHVFAPGADEVWGNAILTRLPVAEWSTGRLPRGNDPMPRGQLAAVIDVAPDRQLGVVGTHLSHVQDQGATRLPQARAVAGTVAWLRERNLPTAVLGDLNAEPGSAEIQTFGSFVGPTLPDGNPTWPSWDPQEQIDHVLVSPDLQVTHAEVIETQASDHLPVVVSVLIARG